MLTGVRGALAKASGRLGAISALTHHGGGIMRGMGSDLARYGSNAAWGMARMSNTALTGTLGAIGGGAYGAVSSDTSVIGGALMGATGATIGRGISRGVAAGRLAGNFSVGAKVAGRAMMRDGRRSGRFIGNTAGRAYNRIRSTLTG